MPSCANKGCPNMARIGKKYCSTECYNAAVTRRNKARKRTSSRYLRAKYKAMLSQTNKDRGAARWRAFVENLPPIDWEEALMTSSVYQLATDMNISFHYLRRYLNRILALDLSAYSRERSRHLISEAQLKAWERRRAAGTAPPERKKPPKYPQPGPPQIKPRVVESNINVDEFISELTRQKG